MGHLDEWSGMCGVSEPLVGLWDRLGYSMENGLRHGVCTDKLNTVQFS